MDGGVSIPGERNIMDKEVWLSSVVNFAYS